MSELQAYEGLVIKTSAMYYRRLGLEQEDLQQILRIKVWRALEAYKPERGGELRSWVFGAVTNQITDLTRARMRALGKKDWLDREVGVPVPTDFSSEPHFNGSCEDNYDFEKIELPDTLDEVERCVVALLYIGYSRREIAEILGLEVHNLQHAVRRLRAKLRAWHPDHGHGDAELIQLEIRVKRGVTRLAA